MAYTLGPSERQSFELDRMTELCSPNVHSASLDSNGYSFAELGKNNFDSVHAFSPGLELEGSAEYRSIFATFRGQLIT